MKICINLISTNKYTYFLENICKSIEDFFFPEDDVSVIVHTNKDITRNIENIKKIKVFINEITHEDWPMTTLKRFHYFLKSKDILESNDWCFYIDVDSLFIKKIGKEILPDSGMIGTIHPCQIGGGTPDRNPLSKAYIPYGSGNRYFCGGFFGGISKDFIKMSETISSNIDEDFSKNIIALWHDESHLNKYFYENPPKIYLENPFAIAQNLNPITDKSYVLFLDKSPIGGHDFFRSL
jgi:hypothetical protein